jgi:hypothetical protein
MYWLILQMRNCHGGIMVTVELDKCESSIGLHPNFDNITITLEKRNQIGLTDIGDEIANVDCRVEFGGLSGYDIVRESWGWGV